MPQVVSSSDNQRRAASHRGAIVAGIILVILIGVVASVRAAQSTTTSDDVLAFLNHSVDWYRRIAAVDQTPVNSEEVLFRDSVRNDARQVLRLGFDFAHADAAILITTEKNGPPTTTSAVAAANIAQLAVAANQRVAQIQSQLDQLDLELQKASATSRPTLNARRDKLVSQLSLATARRDVVQSYSKFTSGIDTGGASGLEQHIQELQGSTPEAQGDDIKTADAKAATTADAAAAQQQGFHPDSAGLFGLVSEMFTLSRSMSDLNELAGFTDLLKKRNEEFRAPLRTELHDAIARSDAISKESDSDDPAKLAAQKQELDALAVRFKLLSAAVVPLGEQNLLLDSLHRNLLEWRASLDRTYSRALHYLMFRVGGTLITILVIFVISEAWRRATFRYVSDARRRRQFMLIRRIVLGIIIMGVIIASFVTEIGSLATFAGFITAGIAVALQTVIVSGVAYFFFIGRFGVRVGDRVTISGITGDVVEIGLFRLYLMELGGGDRDPHPTGRIVVFSNSVLFQPSAFFKQLPGADYVWHEVTMSLSPDTDYPLAESKLLEAVESVYGQYKQEILRQHENVKNEIHVPMEEPRPEARIRFVNGGVEAVVRYPVEIQRSMEIDDLMTRKLLETIESDPNLNMAGSSKPQIHAVK